MHLLLCDPMLVMEGSAKMAIDTLVSEQKADPGNDLCQHDLCTGGFKSYGRSLFAGENCACDCG
jgi:hypothetical protein